MNSFFQPRVLWGSIIASALLVTAFFMPFNASIPKESQVNIQPSINYSAAYKELYQAQLKSIQAYELSKEEIYALTIDQRLTYYFDSLEAIEATLTEVLEASIDTQFDGDVTLLSDMVPKISFVEHPTLSIEINPLTLTGAASSPENKPTSDEDIDDHPLIPELPVITMPPDEVTSFDFQESITIATVTKSGQAMTTPEEVAAELLKTNSTPASYTVVSGDSPSTIAEDNNMTLADLFALNDDLENKAKSLQIGDDLIVEKLVPELCVVIESLESTTVSIPNTTIYQEDEDVYIGLEVLEDEGYNGIKLVTESVETVNGDVLSRKAIKEEILSKPEPKIILVGAKPIPDVGSVGFFIQPLNSYRLSSSYGPRWGGTHKGIDMAVPTGTSVKAADGGTVIYSGWNDGYGYMVEIDHHNGFTTKYAHNSQLLVSVGQEVGQGQVISKSGNTGNSTGPHLHFEISKDGETVNPTEYFN